MLRARARTYAQGFDPAKRSQFERKTQTIQQYVNHRSIKNCATKMLIGAYCARDRNLTANAFEEAKRRLYNFAFVGLTDAFNASACLLCRMYGITPQPFMFSHARSMETQKRHPLIGGGDRVPKECVAA